jgi:hypothetical protein
MLSKHPRRVLRPIVFTLLLAVLGAALGCSRTDTPPASAQQPATTALPTAADGADTSESTQQPASNSVAAAPPAQPQSGDEPTAATFVGLRAPKPATWISQPRTSRMRAAQFLVPGSESSDAAHVIVFYFGEGQGGDVQSNIDRWTAQFRSEDGQLVEPVVSQLEADGMPVTMVELAGAWQDMGAASHKPGVLFLAAIVESPSGNVFIRFVGPADVVNRDRAAFMELVRGIERES